MLNPKNKNVIIFGAFIIVLVIVIIFVSVALLKKNTSNSVSVHNTAANSQTNGLPTDSSGKIVQPAYKVNVNNTDFSVPVSAQSTKGVSAADKKAVYEGLLAGFKIMTSGDAKAVRAYLLEKATTPAEKNIVNKMNDADIASLSARLAATMVMPTPQNLLTPNSIWTRDGNTMTIQYTDPITGPTTKRAVLVNGKWY